MSFPTDQLERIIQKVFQGLSEEELLKLSEGPGGIPKYVGKSGPAKAHFLRMHERRNRGKDKPDRPGVGFNIYIDREVNGDSATVYLDIEVSRKVTKGNADDLLQHMQSYVLDKRKNSMADLEPIQKRGAGGNRGNIQKEFILTSVEITQEDLKAPDNVYKHIYQVSNIFFQSLDYALAQR